jgi:hypothetical protein
MQPKSFHIFTQASKHKGKVITEASSEHFLANNWLEGMSARLLSLSIANISVFSIPSKLVSLISVMNSN